MRIAGLSFVVEQTGGGCTAAVAYVEGGTIVVTDGNLGTDFGSLVESGGPAADAGWYPGTSWQDPDEQHDSAVEGQGATVEAAVEALLVKVAQSRR